METMKLQKKTPVSAMLDPKIVMPAIRSAIAKLDPRLMIKNPVMFVVEVVAALTTVVFLRNLVMGGGESLGFTFQIILWLWFTVLFANFAEAVAEGRGKAQAESLRKTRTESQAKLLAGSGNELSSGIRHQPQGRRHRAGRSRRQHSLRRRGDRRRRLGQRSRDHRRVRARDPRIRRRPLGGHRRHPGAVRLDPRSHHRGAGLDLHRPHDQAGRGRRAAEDAERDCAQHPAGGPDHHLRVRDRNDPELCDLCRRFDFGGDPGGAVRDADSDHHRCAVVRDRHRRHGPAGALQRAGDVGPRGRGRRRRRYAAARQDRHHHARQPAGDGVPAGARGERAGTGGCGAARLTGRRDPRGPLDRRAREGEIRHPQPRHGGACRNLHSLHRADPHERRRCRRVVGPQRRGRCDPQLRWRRYLRGGVRQHRSRDPVHGEFRSRARDPDDFRRNRQGRRHPARGRQGRTPARRRAAQGHRQGRHPRTLCRTAPHGHPHRHDHGRQSDDRGGDRGGGRGRRFSRPGDTRRTS